MIDTEAELAHILLVEDNEGDILLTLEAFEECNLRTEISIAKNGQEALDFLYKRGKFTEVKKPNLILLDVNIPIFNGHEVLKIIKEDAILKKIPVIMLTTSSSEQDVNNAYENHCSSYVQKPLEIGEFLEAIFKIGEFYLNLITLPK
jgi:CheY-like chemotaxis protein